MSECSLSGRGQDHVSNFYIVDLENFVKSVCYVALPVLWMMLDKGDVSRVYEYEYSSSHSNLPHRYGNSRATWDHTVLPTTRQM